jgi:tetratricopeptide (TPR) repeat protein/predicted Ser/Thr protein kinase
LVRGTTLGRYLILDRIGAGGMGVVFAAYDPELDRKVAIKLLHGDQGAGSLASEGHRRLLREAQALARLQHPNVIAVHDVGEHDGRVFLAMEFIEGDTLSVWLRKPRTRDEQLRMFIEAGRGLAAAHAKGLVHRDFKPDNVMIADGRPRVMDFGLARTATQEAPSQELSPTTSALSSELTRDGRVAGTPAYMAPEQHLGGEVGPAADQFAFCIALYEGLYGERPFKGETLAALSLHVCEGRIEDPPRGKRVRPRLRRILLRGLDVQPDRRWPDMQSLIEQLAHDPTNRRRALVFAGIVALAVGGTIGGQAWQKSQRLAQCPVEGAAIRDAWNANVADQVGAALAKTGLGYAGETHSQVVGWLDRFADDWAATREAVCRLEVEDSGLDATQRARALDCLGVQSSEFRTFTERLMEADAAVVQTAVQTAARLPEPVTCTDPSALARQPDIEGERREELSEIRRELARAKIYRTTRDYERAEASLGDLRERAKLLEHAVLVAGIGVEQGLVAGDRADFSRALEMLREAHHSAGGLGADDIAADAAIALAYLAVRRSDLDDALRWTDLASMWIERMEIPPMHVRRADLLEAVAAAHGTRGNYDDALPMQERVIEMRRELLGDDHPRVATALRQYAVTLTHVGRYGDAREAQLSALTTLQRSLGERHPQVALAHNSLGLALQDHGDDDAAIGEYRLAIEIAEASVGESHPAVSIALDNLGLIYRKRKQFDLAQEHHERALAVTLKTFGPDAPDAAASLSNLGIVARERGDLDRALELYEESLRIRIAAFGPEHPEVGISVANIGNVYAHRGEPERALERFHEALKIWSVKLPKDHPRVANVLGSICETQVELGKIQQALDNCERALTILQGPDSDPYRRARAQERLAQTLVKAGAERTRALELAEAARAVYVAQGLDENVGSLDDWRMTSGLTR